METYFATLFSSKLPFGPWLAALIWLALFVANHWTGRIARAATDAQKIVVIEDLSALRRGFQPIYMLGQFLFAAMVFLFGLFLGPAAFVFFGGGLIVSRACALSLNVQSVFASRAMAQPNAATGSVTFSTSLALRQVAQRAGSSALACLLMGLAVAHLALLGGALILGSSAWGFLRRAQRVRKRS